MILHSARRFYYVRSLTFITTLCLTKDRMEAILNTGAFPETAMCIRRAAIKLALRREFVAYANAVREEIEKNDLEAGGTKLIVRKQPIHKIFGKDISLIQTRSCGGIHHH